MSEYRTIHDPFLGKDVQISSNLTDRLRGRYASGPTMPNGEPEFGWHQFDAPPIQVAAADEIDRLRKALEAACGYLLNAKIDLETGCSKITAIRTIEGGLARAKEALASIKETG